MERFTILSANVDVVRNFRKRACCEFVRSVIWLIADWLTRLVRVDRLQSTQQKVLHIVMKPKCFLFLVLLDFGGVGLTVSSIDESNVRSYDVERRISYSDLFVVHVKYGTNCANSTGLSTWCEALNAYQASGNGSYCSCRCYWDFHSFLPLVKKCIKGEQLPEKFGG